MSYIRTKEHRALMSKLKKGKTYGEDWKKKISLNHADVKGEKNPMWGKKRPQSVRDAISKAKKGKRVKNYNFPMLGKKHSLRTILKMRERVLRGSDSPLWKGGITEEHRAIRTSSEYKQWRIAIFERDKYKCVSCGNGGYLQADHIKPFALYPELRFKLSNGRTLCIDCHKNTETFGWKLHHRNNVEKLPEEKVFMTSNGI